MKATALKELQTALQYLNIVKDCGSLNEGEVKFSVGEAIQAIKSAIYSETPTTGRKFDLNKVTCDDQARPVLCGVLHRKGFKVATDSTVLVAVKETYAEELEGHILDKTGRDIIGVYPNWEALVPQKEAGQGYTLDTEKVYELLRRQKAEKKVNKYDFRQAYVKIGNAFFRAEKLAEVCAFMDAYGATEIRVIAPNRAAVVFAPDGSVAIIMPSYYGRYIDENGDLSSQEPTAKIWENHRDGILVYEAA